MIRSSLAAALLLCAPGSMLAQQGGATRVLVVTGLSAEPRYARMFASVADMLVDTARASWRVADSNLVYLAEDPTTDRRITGRSTREAVAAAFATLAQRVRPGDVILIFLLGHGSGEMQTSSVNLPGPDPTAADYAAWLVPLARATVVFVNASSASGDFGPLLAGPNRVIVTATRTAFERNESIFAGYFVAGLTGTAADADKDGRVSVAEAFTFARDQVARVYETSNRLQTEHPALIDSSGIAARVTFGGAAASGDPRVIALVGERRVLEAQLDSLRRQKSAMDSTAFESRLEALLIDIARKTQAIEALQPTARP